MIASDDRLMRAQQGWRHLQLLKLLEKMDRQSKIKRVFELVIKILTKNISEISFIATQEITHITQNIDI